MAEGAHLERGVVAFRVRRDGGREDTGEGEGESEGEGKGRSKRWEPAGAPLWGFGDALLRPLGRLRRLLLRCDYSCARVVEEREAREEAHPQRLLA
jgi:hypothetical protein